MLDNLQTMWENFIDCGSAPLAKRPENTTPFDSAIRRSCSFFLRELVSVCFRKEAWSCQRRLLWENIHFFTPENLQSGLKVQVYEKPWGQQDLVGHLQSNSWKVHASFSLDPGRIFRGFFEPQLVPFSCFFFRVLAIARTWITPMQSL